MPTVTPLPPDMVTFPCVPLTVIKFCVCTVWLNEADAVIVPAFNPNVTLFPSERYCVLDSDVAFPFTPKML